MKSGVYIVTLNNEDPISVNAHPCTQKDRQLRKIIYSGSDAEQVKKKLQKLDSDSSAQVLEAALETMSPAERMALLKRFGLGV